MALQDELRGYVDTENAKRGINWRMAQAYLEKSPGDARVLRDWLKTTYKMDDGAADRYVRSMQGMTLSGDNENRRGEFSWVSPQQPAVDPNEQRRAGVTSQIQAFVDELGKTADMSDPVFAGLIRAGQAEAGARINQTGIRGGLADLTAADATNRAVLPYLAQRQQMRQTGLGMLSNRDATLEQLDQGWANMNLQKQQLDNGQAMQQWAQGKNNAQTIGSAIGGGLGLAGGIAATALTAGAAAPLIPALAAGGSSLGGGLGGMAAPSYAPNPYRINTRPSGFSGY